MFDVWHLGLPVRDLEQSVRFYREGLGFELLGYYEAGRTRMAFVRVPGGSFTIEFLESRDASAEAPSKKPDHLAFESADLAAFHARLSERGFFKDLPEIAEVNNGLQKFTVTDPDGVPIQFYQGRAAFDRTLSRENASRHGP